MGAHSTCSARALSLRLCYIHLYISFAPVFRTCPGLTYCMRSSSEKSKVKILTHKYSGVKILRGQWYLKHELLRQMHVSLSKQHCAIPNATLHYSLLLTFA